MKIIIFITLYFSLSQSHADNSIVVPESDLIKRCGEEPGFLSKMFTDSSKMRLNCLDQIFEEYRAKRDAEVAELDKVSEELKQEIAKVAVSQTVGTLDCGNPNKRSVELVNKCSELNAQRNLILKRISHLMGWDQEFRRKIEANINKPQSIEIETPCPSEEELDKMKAVRYFHRKLYKTYERCRTLNPKF